MRAMTMGGNDPGRGVVSSELPDGWAERFAAAQRLTAEAGALAMRMRPPPGAAQGSLKSAQDWLTEADGTVERFLSDAFAREFPDDGFQGEEGGATRPGALRWVVDPIDGTSNFAHGAPRWCVSVGMLAGEDAVLGVLVAPALGDTFAAVRGGGATLNGTPIRAAATATMGRAIVECGWSPRIPNERYQALCGRVLAAGAMMRAGGSGALGLADVAAGRLDGYVELHINLWDCCAALAVLTEAGAHVNAFLPAGIVGGAPVLGCGPALAAELEAILAAS